MTFAHPWVLLLLVLPAVLLVIELLRVGNGQQPALLARLLGGRLTLPVDIGLNAPQRAARPWLRGVLTAATLLPCVIAALVLVALAGPQRLGPPRQERVLTNIEFVLDVSGSMSSPLGGAGESRYTVSMEAIKQFLERRKGDAFGLTIFGSETVRWVPLTRDLSAIQSAGPFLDPSTMPSPLNGTRVGFALRYSMETLRRSEETGEDGKAVSEDGAKGGDRMIVLITDGFSSDLDGGLADKIGNELREAGIVVHGVQVGEDSTPAQLLEVVTPTGGQVFNAKDAAGMNTIFEAIDKITPTKVRGKQPETIDWLAPVLIALMAVTGVHGVCLWKLRWTPW